MVGSDLLSRHDELLGDCRGWRLREHPRFLGRRLQLEDGVECERWISADGNRIPESVEVVFFVSSHRSSTWAVPKSCIHSVMGVRFPSLLSPSLQQQKTFRPSRGLGLWNEDREHAVHGALPPHSGRWSDLAGEDSPWTVLHISQLCRTEVRSRDCTQPGRDLQHSRVPMNSPGQSGRAETSPAHNPSFSDAPATASPSSICVLLSQVIYLPLGLPTLFCLFFLFFLRSLDFCRKKYNKNKSSVEIHHTSRLPSLCRLPLLRSLSSVNNVRNDVTIENILSRDFLFPWCFFFYNILVWCLLRSRLDEENRKRATQDEICLRGDAREVDTQTS